MSTAVGRALVYTALTVSLGFSILTLSGFVPTIYFGLFTGIVMLMALASGLALLIMHFEVPGAADAEQDGIESMETRW